MPDDEPTPIGPDIDRILNGLLPEHRTWERDRLLQNHDGAVLEVRERARRAWQEIVSREITMLLLEGLEERVAELAARNNLAVRKQELDDELRAELARLQGELTRRLRRLVEDDGAAQEDEGGEAPAA